ncbi:MAG: hypothetical protein ACJ8R9_35050 [Steroidobacteraceae bacterium]
MEVSGGVLDVVPDELEFDWSVQSGAVLSLLWQSVVPVLLLRVPDLLVLVSVDVLLLVDVLVPVEPASARRLVPELPVSFLEPMSEHPDSAAKLNASAVTITLRLFI